jgi:hypothetical protein
MSRTLVAEPRRDPDAPGGQGACGASVLLVGASRAHLETPTGAVAALFAGSMLGGWLITFFANAASAR